MKNPIIDPYLNEYGSIPFSIIQYEHFLPAIEMGISNAYDNIKKITHDNSEPTFENTIEAIENLTYILDKATNVYFNLYSLDSNSEFKELSDIISPKLAKLTGDIYTNDDLFSKVKIIFDKKNHFSLSLEESRLLENTYKSFTRNGALLNKKDKTLLKNIDHELSTLSPKFSKNTLDAINNFEIHIIDDKRVKGIPKTALNAAEHLAKEKGYEGGWLFNLQMPSYIPVLQYAEDRMLRKDMSIAYGVKNLEGKYDNREIILKTVKLKNQRAKLLGFKNHAEYTLDKRMAKNVKTVNSFLDDIHKIVYPAAKNELSEVKSLAFKLDGIEDFQSWDFSYYSQKLKIERYNFDPEELRQYLKSENVVDGAFTVAGKMYGLKFIQIFNIDKYNKDIKTYEVIDENDQYIGLLYIDLYPRETKRGGAWMNTFQVQGLQEGKIKRPHILISGNLTPSTPEQPSLLSLDEARTIFHEFGHALHGLLSDVKYRSLASPNVLWDFVELPSQIMENWLLEPETLSLFAKHFETGETIPTELVSKVKDSQNFNAGSMNNRQLSLGYLDMAWFTTDPENINDVEEFENQINEKTRLLPITKGNTSTGFGHIFAGGYSAGYYSYKWAEVLDADAFEFFKEKGIFNKDIAKSFRENILAKGDTVDPMLLYKKFRGKEPDSKSLLRRDGLI